MFKPFLVRYIFILVLGLCFMWGLNGQTRQMKFKYLTMEDGLSQSSGEAIFQDSHGFIWIGTRNGLNRYDGHEIKMYKPTLGDKNSISHYVVNSIAEDKDEYLWVGTEGGGLNRFEPHSGKFIQYRASGFLQHGLTTDLINELFLDSTGKLWILSQDGLFQYYEDNETFENVYQIEEGKKKIVYENISAICEDNHKNIWYATDNSIFILDAGYNLINEITLSEYNSNKVNRISDIVRDENGNMWIGTDIGIFKLSIVENHTSKFRIEYFPIYEDNHLITSISELKIGDGIFENLLLIGSLGEGLISFNIYTNSYSITKSLNTKEDGLINNLVSTIFIDRSGLLWVGTQGGICIYNSLASVIENYTQIPYMEDDIPMRNLHSIMQDDQGNTWIATKGDGLISINKNEMQSGIFTYESTNGKLCSNKLRSFFKDSRGNFWIGYDDRGLGFAPGPIFNPSKIINYRDITNVPNALKQENIYDIIESYDGLIWFASEEGLHQFDYVSNSFASFYKDSNDSTSISENSVYCVYEDRDSIIWIGTFGGNSCFSQLDRTSNTFINYSYSPQNKNSISGNDITSIINDSGGGLWLTFRREGICHFNKATKKFTNIQERDGLASNFAYSVIVDHQNNLWVGSNNGISKIDLTDTTIINYSESDGLQSNEFNGRSSYIDKNGAIYFGGKSGFNIINPEQITSNHIAPEILLTDFRLFNKSIYAQDGNKILTESIYKTDKISLKHNQNYIAFSFSICNFEGSNKNRYSYILEGFMGNWIDLGSTNTITLTNLDPGSYILKIKGVNGDGIVTEKPISLEIRVMPPLWKRWWAYLIYLGILGYLIFWVNRNSRERLEMRHNLEIEKINRQKSLELNDLKLRFFTSISHEIRTPLSLIIGPLENLLNEGRFSLKEVKQLQIMKKNALYLLGLLENLMAFRKLEKGKMKLAVNRGDLNNVLLNCCASFDNAADLRNIRLKYDFPYNKLNCWFDQKKVEMVVYNLISNAFKYSNDNSEISIELEMLNKSKEYISPKEFNEEFLKEKCFARISVKDQGVGIAKENLKGIFERFAQVEEEGKQEFLSNIGIGLSVVKEIVGLHKGKIKVDSKKDLGSSFHFIFPVNRDVYTATEIKENEKTKSLPISENLYLEVPTVKEDIKDIYIDSDELLKEECSGQRILIIDDNNELNEFLVSSFEGEYNVESAYDGDEALKKIRVNTPDLIVSDIMMPGIDGYELCQKVRTEIPNYVPYILLTAKTTESDAYEGYEMGADAYIIKPFNINMLKLRVKKLLESRKILQSYFKTTGLVLEESEKFSTNDEKFLHKIVEEIKANLGNSEFSVTELASKVAMSRSHLYRRLKSLTNQIPNDFIKSIRLNHAADLLGKKKYSVSEISYHVGFNDPKYFSKCFRQMFSVSPTEYSKMHLEEKNKVQST